MTGQPFRKRAWSRSILCVILLGLILAAGGCGFFSGLFGKKKAEEDSDVKGKVAVKVTIIARRYSFQPNLIRVKQGVPLEITLKSEDVPHGFGIRRPGRTQNFGAFEPDKPLHVVIRTDKKEVIEFFSTVYSGVGYYKMKGQIIVE
ncbi:MAG: hypothetical protein ACE5JS_12060 [Nitrospinota bacterium]